MSTLSFGVEAIDSKQLFNCFHFQPCVNKFVGSTGETSDLPCELPLPFQASTRRTWRDKRDSEGGEKIAQIVAKVDCCPDFLGPSGGGPPPVPMETPELARRLAVGQTRNQSLFMCLEGESRLGVRLRRARNARGLMAAPRALQPNPQSSLTPKTHK